MPNTKETDMLTGIERAELFAELSKMNVLPKAGTSVRKLKSHALMRYISATLSTYSLSEDAADAGICL